MWIVNCEQGSDEWLALRFQRMTASHAQAIASNGKGLETYIINLMKSSYSNAKPDNYVSWSMRRGIELEPSALFAYEVESGYTVDKVGFVIHDEYIGCSPDGLTAGGCLEIKCLEDEAYFNYMLTEKINTGYEWQMQMQMLISEREWCDYVVYNPNFKKSLIIKRVFKDGLKFEKLEQGFLSGIDKMNKIKNKMDKIL